ncbi:MAG: hypothetical protein AAF449_04940 [Myxococcota bacterium]
MDNKLALVGFTLAAACGSDPAPPNPTWSTAFDAARFGWLLNVWGSSADDLYAVGGSPSRGRMTRFDGQAWTDVDLGLEVPLLNWAFGFGANDVFVVGNQGTVLRRTGQGWTATATITDQDLWGVWGANPNDVWAVGGNGREEGQATLLRFDGASWRRVEVPALSRSGVFAFFKVWGTSADNVYVVGQRGAVLRWNGTELTEVLVGTSRDLIALWGTGPESIVIVGGRANGQVVTWDGSQWRTTLLALRPGLNGVWMNDPKVAHLVGLNGSILRFDVDTEEVIDDSPPEVGLDFHAVFGDPAGQGLVAVGGNFQFVDGPYEGVAYQRSLKNGD